MRICVYCSSSAAVEGIYVRAARELGRLIGERGHELIYGGCRVGLMGELARSAKAAGGRVIGIIPQQFIARGLAYEEADEMLPVHSLAERKALMVQRAEAFVALPGGFGTLDELADVLTRKQLGEARGAIVLLNVDGFYDYLLAHLEQLYRLNFAKADMRRLYNVAATPAEALDCIERHVDIKLPLKWF